MIQLSFEAWSFTGCYVSLTSILWKQYIVEKWLYYVGNAVLSSDNKW